MFKQSKCYIALLLVTLMVASVFSGCGKKENGLTQITLSEVAHSIFYAPQYVAIENGYFKDEGIDLKVVTSFGADKVMTALVSNAAQIGFMGSESSIYVYNEGAEDYVVNFAQLTQRAGNFLVGRSQVTDFQWKNLKGKTIIGGRAGGMPEMILEYILKNKGLDIKKDVTIIQNIDFGITAEAFSSGQADYTVEFEPFATSLEKGNKGYVVTSLGIDSGYVPYTAYSAKNSYMKKNPEIIQKFTNAIQKGLDYVNSNTSQDIAKIIAPQFPDTDIDTIATIVERYKSQDTWKGNTIFEQSSFDLLQGILDNAGVLTKKVPYSDLVNTKFAVEAVK